MNTYVNYPRRSVGTSCQDRPCTYTIFCSNHIIHHHRRPPGNISFFLSLSKIIGPWLMRHEPIWSTHEHKSFLLIRLKSGVLLGIKKILFVNRNITFKDSYLVHFDLSSPRWIIWWIDGPCPYYVWAANHGAFWHFCLVRKEGFRDWILYPDLSLLRGQIGIFEDILISHYGGGFFFLVCKNW